MSHRLLLAGFLVLAAPRPALADAFDQYTNELLAKMPLPRASRKSGN